MAGKVAQRRAALREVLIQSAQRRIAEDGLNSLKARDLAKDAGCALGAIYNVFEDLHELILEVNARTFKRLGAAVAAGLNDASDDPTERLVAMGQAYHHFATREYMSWRTLFDVARTTEMPTPDWYLAEIEQLFIYISKPLAELFPDSDAEERVLLTRGLFSSVHGIVFLGLDKVNSGVPVAEIDRTIALILRRFAA